MMHFRLSPFSGSGLVLVCLLLGAVQTYAFNLTLTDSEGIVCLYASWNMSFLIMYETANGNFSSVFVTENSNVTYNGSRCGDDSNEAKINVHIEPSVSWSVSFSKAESSYSIGNILLSYNTNDTTRFPGAAPKGIVRVDHSESLKLPFDVIFKCRSLFNFSTASVTQNYWDIDLQVFIQNGTVSKKEYECEEDSDITTKEPRTHNTMPPHTTALTPTSTPPPTPVVGNYSITNGNTTCLLATMGLQLNITEEKVPFIFNINPSMTNFTGSCHPEKAQLRLNNSQIKYLDFVFAVKNENRFYLKEVNVSMYLANGSAFSVANNNLSFWDAPLGSSYLCNKEQVVFVSEKFQINTFNLKVQPFNVTEGKYSTAQDCSADEDNFLVPIAVGAALAGVLILVLLAYFIGLKRHHTGYEQF
ncbi:lysosome-associated membrane glycoprotein 2 [Acomys russatus]|uniref:lysosome-associated membrane glycoprotein 2 n=1 Tax=Acomys russatus TaxID=60746 RepID=UPI0021E1BFA5|nr:lysosome-associated membrane glycoprotein 2 [Acomys russatus]